MFIYFLTGVTVYVPEPINNQSQVNVMFHNGAGLEVTELFGHISVRVFVPFVFMVGQFKCHFCTHSGFHILGARNNTQSRECDVLICISLLVG